MFRRGKLSGRGKVFGSDAAYAQGTAFSLASTISNAVSKAGSWLSGLFSGSSSSSKKTSSKKSSSKKKSSGGGGGGGSSSAAAAPKELQTVDWIEVAIDRIERTIDNIERVADSSFRTLAVRLGASADEMSNITKEIELQRQGYERYIKQADSIALADDLKQKVREGIIDINQYDDNTQKLINDYKEWYDKALDCSDAVEELNEKISELYENRFDTIQTDFENQLKILEHQTSSYSNALDMIEERGYMGGLSFYEGMRKIEQENIDLYNKEIADLTKVMSDAVLSGAISKGSEAWYDMQTQINDVRESIQESELEIVKYNNAIRDLNWETFDYMQDRISKITDESEFLIELMESSKLFEDNGQMSGTGMAQLGLHTLNYDVYMSQAEKYADEIKNVNALIANDPNNTKLIERREELLDLQQESILAAEHEKTAVKDLVEEGFNIELDALKDLIDAYEDTLDSAKDLYDYQKKINSQSKEIASLQKQLAAYQGDTSEENRARLQKLQASLTDAVEKLEESQYDQYIKDQKKLLGDLYDSYEETLNARLDDIDALMNDMIDTANANAAAITQTLIDEGNAVGYTLSDYMASIWTKYDTDTVLNKHGEEFFKQFTTLSNTIDGIASHIASIVNEGNSTAANMLLSSGTGFAQGGFVSGLQRVAYRNGDNIVSFNSLKRGEAVLTPEQSVEFEKLVGSLPQIQNLVDMSGYINALRNGTGFSGTNIEKVNYETNVQIDHVSDYNDFVAQLQNDNKFEKMIQSMTIDRINGGSQLSKHKYNW